MGRMPDVPMADVVTHADWSVDPRKRLLAVARLVAGPDGPRYQVVSLAAAGRDLLGDVRRRYRPSTVLAGFDFPLGLPRGYAQAAGVESFGEFLGQVGSPPWDEFENVASGPAEISLRRPFYPDRPGGTRRSDLHAGLGLSGQHLRRRCDGTDAETLFWTLGAKQVGKAALNGWAMLRQAQAGGAEIALWPFAGPLSSLLAGPVRVVAAETYPREFYRRIGAPPRAGWSKRRRADRLQCIPGLLRWAGQLGVSWDGDVMERVTEGCSGGPTGEDEFDAVVGVLGMISVVTGAVAPGVPADDPAVTAIEGWILGRASSAAAVQIRARRSSGCDSPAHQRWAADDGGAT